MQGWRYRPMGLALVLAALAWGTWTVAAAQSPALSAPSDLEADDFGKVAAARDVAWLESVADFGRMPGSTSFLGGLASNPKDLRTAAYARLGALGTAESLAAVRRIEEAAKAVPLTPERLPLGTWTHPGWHFADWRIEPLARATRDGTTWAVVQSGHLGDEDLFLTASDHPDDPAAWSRPKLIPKRAYRGMTEPELRAAADGTLRLTFVQGEAGPRGIMEGTHEPPPPAPATGPQTWTISPAEVLRDADGDGWTDAEERRMGLDPRRADTDGDGTPDGRDPCPDWAPKPADLEGEEVEILGRALFATLGLTGSRALLLVDSKVRPVPVWGYAGPVLYHVDAATWRREHGDAAVAVFVSWKVLSQSPAEAVVEIVDSEGPLAAGSQQVVLRKLDGHWYAVERRIGWVA